jgi:anti-anti-sigma factor
LNPRSLSPYLAGAAIDITLGLGKLNAARIGSNTCLGAAMSFNAEQFSITDAEINGLVGVAVSGELDAATSDRLAAALEACNGASILLDLEECAFVDSSGIRTIVEAVRRLDDEGRKLVVCNMRGQVREMIELVQLDALDGVRVYSGPPTD